MGAWSKDLEANNSEDNQKIGDIFIRIGPFLMMYTEYIKDFDKATSLINDTYTKNPKFRAVMDEIHVSYILIMYRFTEIGIKINVQ